MLLNDRQIRELAAQGMIKPFTPDLVREVDSEGRSRVFSSPCPIGQYRKVLSFGCGSFGLDLRLSPKDFRIFRHIPGTVVDPKNFSSDNLISAPLHEDPSGQFFIIPAHSYGLGVALEHIRMPNYLTAICTGKSTYARCGVIANITPIEAMWSGYLTLEFSNSSDADCRIYANEGVVQLLFFEGDPCEVSYADRQGKYQDQSEVVTLAKV